MSERVSINRQRKLLGLTSIAAFVALLLSIAVPVAQAATSYYAIGLEVSSGQVVYSGVRPVIKGGAVEAAVGVGTLDIATYYDYPGYTEIGHGRGPGGSLIKISHATVTNAHSKCWWHIFVGGEVDITCSIEY